MIRTFSAFMLLTITSLLCEAQILDIKLEKSTTTTNTLAKQVFATVNDRIFLIENIKAKLEGAQIRLKLTILNLKVAQKESGELGVEFVAPEEATMKEYFEGGHYFYQMLRVLSQNLVVESGDRVLISFPIRNLSKPVSVVELNIPAEDFDFALNSKTGKKTVRLHINLDTNFEVLRADGVAISDWRAQGGFYQMSLRQ